MAYEVVRVVTQPFHGADGIEVLFSPGEQFPAATVLPDGVRSRLAVAEVPDAVPAPKKPRRTAPDASSPAGAEGDAAAGGT